MKIKPIKIGVSGTHSTGKSTLLLNIYESLKKHDVNVAHINSFAKHASDIGFPILVNHTYESTLWIMANGLCQESLSSLTSDVILIDRPIFDALGYYEAALEISRRQADPNRLIELRTIARMHVSEYAMIIVTALDRSVPLGQGRDSNEEYRELVGRHIARFTSEMAPYAIEMTSKNTPEIAKKVVDFILGKLR